MRLFFVTLKRMNRDDNNIQGRRQFRHRFGLVALVFFFWKLPNPNICIGILSIYLFHLP